MVKRKLRGFEDVLLFKRSKEQEKFSIEKYKKSILAAGVDKEECDQLIDEVALDPRHYFSTAKVHHATYRALLKRSSLVAANYNIPNAIYGLGPSGFPFEVFCSEMLKAKGFQTKLNVIKKGEFIKHEVDVIARREDVNLFCEAKFHNRKSYKNDVKVALYVYARYLDLKKGNPGDDFKYVLISNAKFSKDAITYSEGVGLVLISMNYPKKDTFIDHIRRYKVYPVTVLNSLKKSEKRKLLEKRIVTVKQLERSYLEDIGLEPEQIVKVMQEVKVLTRPN